MALQLIGDERPPRAVADAGGSLRRRLLAGAALAGDENRCPRRCHQADLIVNGAHRWRATDEAAVVGRARRIGGGRTGRTGRARRVLFAPPAGEGGLEPLDQRLGADRFRHEIGGASLHRGNRGIQRSGHAGGDQRIFARGEIGKPRGAADRLQVGDDDGIIIPAAAGCARLGFAGTGMGLEPAERALGDHAGKRSPLARIGVDNEHVDRLWAAAESHLRATPPSGLSGQAHLSLIRVKEWFVVGWAKARQRRAHAESSFMGRVGTALARLCPPYN